MTVLRLGAPETEKEGVVLEKSNHGNRVTLRGWYGPAVNLIPAQHFSIAEIAQFLGLRMPEPGTKKPHRRPLERIA